MKQPVLTALTDPLWEAELLAALERRELGVQVARRCVDVTDLLAAAAAGAGRVALVSADLRRVDRETLMRLSTAGVAVVAVLDGDERAEARMRQLGVTAFVSASDPVESVAASVLRAARGVQEPVAAASAHEAPQGQGRVIAVWGPHGSPGRSTVAVNLAAELAAAGDALLVDADVYGGAVGQLLGLLEEAPGLAAAARAANRGELDTASLASHARDCGGGLRVLTGITRPDRWTELRASAVEEVLRVARSLSPHTVVDCGFSLEEDEALSFDTAAPRRNGATLAALAAADEVVVVGTPDPVGLQRLVRGITALREAVPGCEPVVVVNRVRPGLSRGDVEREVQETLLRHTGLQVAVQVPLDQRAFDAAVLAGKPLCATAPDAPARTAMTRLARRLGPASATPAAPPRRGWSLGRLAQPLAARVAARAAVRPPVPVGSA